VALDGFDMMVTHQSMVKSADNQFSYSIQHKYMVALIISQILSESEGHNRRFCPSGISKTGID
jgi:hypothetical protein